MYNKVILINLTKIQKGAKPFKSLALSSYHLS